MKAALRTVCLSLCLCLCLSGCLAGCGRDVLVESYDNLLKAAGDLSLTPGLLLAGDRWKGPDGYSGSYQACYRRFSGTETLLGGTTALDSHTIEVTCSIDAKAGMLKVVLQRGSEEEVLLEGAGEYQGTLELEPGSNFLCAVGESFTGSLTLNSSEKEEWGPAASRDPALF